MDNNLKIRNATLGDAKAITDCVVASYSHYIDRIGELPGPMLEDYSEVINQHTVFVLTDESAIVGLLVLIVQPGCMLLDNISVHPSYQGRGLGRRLMMLAERETLRSGMDLIKLYTNESMTENIDIYGKLGYIETERKLERGYSRIYMQKKLTAPSI